MTHSSCKDLCDLYKDLCVAMVNVTCTYNMQNQSSVFHHHVINIVPKKIKTKIMTHLFFNLNLNFDSVIIIYSDIIYFILLFIIRAFYFRFLKNNNFGKIY